MSDGPAPPLLRFRPATVSDVPLLRALAERIWRVSYADMLRPEQIDHMLAWMYGAETIAAELAAGVLWIVAETDGQAVGYLSVGFDPAGAAELNKLYLLPERQGRGEGQSMLAEVERLARLRGVTELRLRVNKTNHRALRAYAKAGFVQVGALVADIGGGFVMDDFVLSKRVATRPA